MRVCWEHDEGSATVQSFLHPSWEHTRSLTQRVTIVSDSGGGQKSSALNLHWNNILIRSLSATSWGWFHKIKKASELSWHCRVVMWSEEDSKHVSYVTCLILGFGFPWYERSFSQHVNTLNIVLLVSCALMQGVLYVTGKHIFLFITTQTQCSNCVDQH